MSGTGPCRGRDGRAPRRPRRRTAFEIAAGAVAASLLILAGALGACGGGDTREARVYTEADNGSMIRAAVGETFTIRLGENASTGYTWTLRQSSGLKLLRDEFEQPSTSATPGGQSPALVGAPGTRVFEFEVAGTGKQLVHAMYHRAWEAKDDAGTQEFTLTVEID